MVTRKAIIIANEGGYRNLNLLKGVMVDVENYKSFLKSKAGGEWNENEILVLLNSDAATVQKNISETLADYVFTVFSGHGFINTYTSSDAVCLKDQDFSIGKLVSPSKKQTIVIDACREYHTPTIGELKGELKNAFLSEALERETREIFNTAIEETPAGILLVFATKPNETAGDDENKGGYFNYSFLKAGRDWWNKGNGVLRLDKAVDESIKIMKSTFITTQSPEIAGQSRRLTFPPFAVAKKG
jgi:hypothetical protein